MVHDGPAHAEQARELRGVHEGSTVGWGAPQPGDYEVRKVFKLIIIEPDRGVCHAPPFCRSYLEAARALGPSCQPLVKGLRSCCSGCVECQDDGIDKG